MVFASLHSAGAWSRALVDRLAFVVESFAVALVLLVFLGLAALRFDLEGAAYVWGFFWMRVAQSDAAARSPVLALLTCLLVAATGVCAWVRWARASRHFEAFPTTGRARRLMLERLG